MEISLCTISNAKQGLTYTNPLNTTQQTERYDACLCVMRHVVGGPWCDYVSICATPRQPRVAGGAQQHMLGLRTRRFCVLWRMLCAAATRAPEAQPECDQRTTEKNRSPYSAWHGINACYSDTVCYVVVLCSSAKPTASTMHASHTLNPEIYAALFQSRCHNSASGH